MIFVDTSAWLFLMDDRQNHSNASVARAFFRSRGGQALVTSELIAAETYKWMMQHDRPFAIRYSVLEALVTQKAAKVLETVESDRVAAIELMQKFSDQDLSYEDAVSVALMNRLGIKKVFSFDKHFLLFPGIVRVP